MYREVEQSGGMTSLTVTGKQSESGMYVSMRGSSGDQEEPNKYITDDVIQQLRQLEHVKSADPVLELSAIALKGKYMGYLQLKGMSPEALEKQNIELAKGGRLPDRNRQGKEIRA